jgi:hypothetical protein
VDDQNSLTIEAFMVRHNPTKIAKQVTMQTLLEGTLAFGTLEFGGVTPEAFGKLPGILKFGAVMLLAVLMLEMAGGVFETGIARAVLLEKPAVAGVEV